MPLADSIIGITESNLSDGSPVYEVFIRSPAFATVKFPAVTEKDAQELAEKIKDAINEHTVFTAEVR